MEQLRGVAADPERAFPEKPQLLYLLTLLRNSIEAQDDGVPRLLFVVAHVLGIHPNPYPAHGVREWAWAGKVADLMLHPQDPAYPVVNSHLLAKVCQCPDVQTGGSSFDSYSIR